MREQILPKEKRFVSMKAYQDMTGLSYKTLKYMVDSGQIKHVYTEAGICKIDTHADSNTDISQVMDKLNEMQKLVIALCRQFNTTT